MEKGKHNYCNFERRLWDIPSEDTQEGVESLR